MFGSLMTEPGKNFLRSLIDVSHVEFQSYDLHTHKLLFSSGLAEKLLGYTAAEYTGLSANYYQNLIHPADRQNVAAAIDRLTKSPDNLIIELTSRARRKDGKYIWVYSRQMICERDKKGRPKTIIRIVEDVTETVKMKLRLEKQVNALEKISYTNSHLLRGPVASIIGLANLIEEDHITSEHNKTVFQYLKYTIQKLDDVIIEINENAKN